MSRVTSIILTVSAAEPGFDVEDQEFFTDKIDEINSFIRSHDLRNLNFLTPSMRTGKDPQTMTFGGGYNHFPDKKFLEFIEKFEWTCPENVVLVLQPEDGRTIVWRPMCNE